MEKEGIRNFSQESEYMTAGNYIKVIIVNFENVIIFSPNLLVVVTILLHI